MEFSLLAAHNTSYNVQNGYIVALDMGTLFDEEYKPDPGDLLFKIDKRIIMFLHGFYYKLR